MPREKVSSVEKAYDIIRGLIVEQKLLPGQQIVELQMTELCGVSRTPVREAIRLLERDGLVDCVPNKGSFLKRITKEDVVMGYEAVAAVEGQAAWLVAEKVARGLYGEPDLAGLQHHLVRMEAELENNEIKQWANSDDAFHSLFMEMSANKYLIRERNQIRSEINQVLWFFTPVGIDKALSNEEHAALFAAVATGNADAAKAAAHNHRIRVRDILKQAL